MRNRLSARIAAGMLALGCISCEQPFDPKTSFVDRYVLYCVLTVRTGPPPLPPPPPPVAILRRTFDVEGTEPPASVNGPSVPDALITLEAAGTETLLDEIYVNRSDSTRYLNPPVYYQGPVISLHPGDHVAITARLKDGTVLASATDIPSYKILTTSPVWEHGVTTRVSQFTHGNVWGFNWDDYKDDQHLYFPRLLLRYLISTDSSETFRSVEIPTQYARNGDAWVAVYPGWITTKSLAYRFEAIDTTLAWISAGDPEKSRYRVSGFTFELTEFDFPLSRYYASVNGYLDPYSIRLDETNYTNIAGGLGVFGSAYVSSSVYPIDQHYATTFGYGVY